ncbi:NEL-type E3 ubiquitin ligase domain-containing protein [Pseudomonas sp. MNR3A]|uniref:NEL-type E3 ubiquitin ligase domain-containing protein n=1 Tax=Pseudomonas sp. MNR3A TaxID=2615213 RepID=UPI0015B57D7F|nr:NEL-type E3 ubiquitin ligase domain-containing protein [Pseudomonas sp. MNR3A]
MSSLPYQHEQQILRTLPNWSKDLHPQHFSALLDTQRSPHLYPSGHAYDWYASALPEDQAALRNALDQRAKSVRALQASLAELKGISDFCRPLLQQYFSNERTPDGEEHSVDVMQYYTQAAKVELPKPGQTETVYTPTGTPVYRSVLAAALHNFKSEQDRPRFAGLRHFKGDNREFLIHNLTDFIVLTRRLDLGQQYQAHLASIYDGSNAEQIRQDSMLARRDELRVQARIAYLKGDISQTTYTALHELCADLPTDGSETHEVKCQSLSVFGFELYELMLISIVTPKARCVVLYLPGNSSETLREFKSMAECHIHLRTRLLDANVRQTFIGYTAHAVQPALSTRLRNALYSNPTANDAALIARTTVNLDTSLTDLPSSPWSELERRHVKRMKADARSIAVPTADVDAQARLERLEFWAVIGMDILNIAAAYIPGLNPVMSLVVGAQMMESVFDALHAWEENDNAQAIAHLKSLAINTGLLVGTVAGGAVLQSHFVDSMQSIHVNGQERLWSPNMGGYASDLQLPSELEPNARGQYVYQDKTYVRLGEDLYEQFQDMDGQWRVRHPSNPHAYSPLLVHNDAGAWRVAHENPLAWDSDTLLERQGSVARSLSVEQRNSALLSTGLGADVLRRQLMENTRTPAQLLDAFERLRTSEEISGLTRSVREGTRLPAHKNFALNALTQLPEWPSDHVLEVFAGNERAGEFITYPRASRPDDHVVQLSREELENGELASVVLAQMDAEQASHLAPVGAEQTSQVVVLQERLANQLEADRQSIFASLRAAKVEHTSLATERLSQQFPGLPEVAVDEIVESASPQERVRMNSHDGRIPLRVAEEARLLQASIRLDRAILGLKQSDLATTDTAILRDGLQTQPPKADAALFELATADRNKARQLIGQQPVRPGFRSPLRLSDGRLGYPLSGRGVPGPRARLRVLYPGSTDARINELIATLGEGRVLRDNIARLEHEWRTLNRDIDQWTQASWEAGIDTGSIGWDLMAAWRNTQARELELIALGDEVSTLPRISARFPNVRTLRLNRLGLTALQPGLLDCFPALERLEILGNPQIGESSLTLALRAAPNLRRLVLVDNGLTGLSMQMQETLAAMPYLRDLDLGYNSLSLSAADIDFLAARRLETLNLNNNHITLDATSAGRFRQMVDVRHLNLRGNPLGVAPDVGYMARLSHLNLSRCNLEQWPQGLTTLMSQRQYQLRELDLSRNRISTLPDLDNILVTPFAQGIRARQVGLRWSFNYNALEREARSGLARIQLVVHEHEGVMSPTEAFMQTDATPAQRLLWADLFGAGENQALLDKLGLLRESADSQQQPVAIRRRVWALLEAAGESTELREKLNDVAEQYPTSCGDAGTDAFSALETEVSLQKINQGDFSLRDKWTLLRQRYRREQVNNLADRIALARSLRKAALQRVLEGNGEDIPALDDLDDPAAVPDQVLLDGPVDDIEIRLALRQTLADDLDYPEPSDNMLYRPTAQLSRKIETNVTKEVTRLDQDPKQVREWIVEQPTWQLSLRRANASQFEAVTEFWRPGLEYLQYCRDFAAQLDGETVELQPITSLSASVKKALENAIGQELPSSNAELQPLVLTDAQAAAAYNALRDEQASVERGLFDSLTREVETH